MTRVIKGQTLSFAADGAAVHESRGAVVVGDDGVILWTGPLGLLPQPFQQADVDDFGDMLVMPGFIDAHIHFPQYRMLAAPGKDLLDWLTRFTFPEESRYADADYARAAAQLFLSRLFQHGTTSALAFCSVHKTCADALFAAMALGFVDVIIEAGFHEWDVAALMPLIEGAGGVITSWDGGTPISGKSIRAVGDKALHAQVMAL